MPFEKKKKYKTAENYRHKNFYLDEDNEYQAECIALLDLCGHKQARFLGLLSHNFIKTYGIDINRLDKDTFSNLIKLLEIQASAGMNPMMPMQNLIAPVGMIANQTQQVNISEKNSSKKKPTLIKEDFIDEDDMDDMNEALAAFGA